MKQTVLLNLLLLVSTSLFAQVGIGTNNPKAMLDVVSPTSGMLIPRYATLASANTKSLPTLNATDHRGLMIYVDEEVNRGFWFYDGAAFVKVGTPTSRTRSISLGVGELDIGTGSSDFPPPTKQWIGTGPTSQPVIAFADRSSQTLRIQIPIPLDWGGTSPFTLTAFYSSPATTGNYSFSVLSYFRDLNSDGTNIITGCAQPVLSSVSSKSNGLMQFTIILCGRFSSSSKVLELYITRQGNDASDTVTENFNLLDLRINYQD